MTSSVLSPTFIIGSIRIGSVEGASCVNLGNNWPTEFTSSSQTQQGFGEISGDGNELSRFHALLDSLTDKEQTQADIQVAEKKKKAEKVPDS
jgi:hypothetical protein